ncbi:hypothetical protein HBB16_03235 [Pseudonocardia sp. MCCB 268]|nr:hypothetical protein [Pseudonocardia cytotoxica]
MQDTSSTGELDPRERSSFAASTGPSTELTDIVLPRSSTGSCDWNGSLVGSDRGVCGAGRGVPGELARLAETVCSEAFRRAGSASIHARPGDAAIDPEGRRARFAVRAAEADTVDLRRRARPASSPAGGAAQGRAIDRTALIPIIFAQHAAPGTASPGGAGPAKCTWAGRGCAVG